MRLERRSSRGQLVFEDDRMRRARGNPLSMGELRYWSSGVLVGMDATGCSGRFGGTVWMGIVLRTWWRIWVEGLRLGGFRFRGSDVEVCCGLSKSGDY